MFPACGWLFIIHGVRVSSYFRHLFLIFFLPKLIFILGLVLDIVEVLLLKHAISV